MFDTKIDTVLLAAIAAMLVALLAKSPQETGRFLVVAASEGSSYRVDTKTGITWWIVADEARIVRDKKSAAAEKLTERIKSMPPDELIKALKATPSDDE